MTLLASFPSDLNVAVIGASGGIGEAVVQLLSDDSLVARSRISVMLAFSRCSWQADFPNVTFGHVDLDDDAAIAAAAVLAAME